MNKKPNPVALATDSLIRFDCSGCGMHLNAPCAAVGHGYTCSSCQTRMSVPRSSPVLELADDESVVSQGPVTEVVPPTDVPVKITIPGVGTLVTHLSRRTISDTAKVVVGGVVALAGVIVAAKLGVRGPRKG